MTYSAFLLELLQPSHTRYHVVMKSWTEAEKEALWTRVNRMHELLSPEGLKLIDSGTLLAL